MNSSKHGGAVTNRRRKVKRRRIRIKITTKSSYYRDIDKKSPWADSPREWPQQIGTHNYLSDRFSFVFILYLLKLKLSCVVTIDFSEIKLKRGRETEGI